MNESPNPAASVDAPMGSGVYFERYWRRATDQRRSAQSHAIDRSPQPS
jgi:hypothetical protein